MKAMVILMSKYTITIKNLIDNNFNFGLDKYPIFNETYRNILNNKILNHYYMCEIGLETAELFKFYLNNRLNEIMHYYNILYKKQEELLEKNIYNNVDLEESTNRKNQTNTSSNSNSNSKNKNLFQDTPQGKIDMTVFDEQIYATNLTLNKGEIADTIKSFGNNNEDFTRKIKGNNGNKYYLDIYKDVKENILNIDMLIINDLKDLFMGIY